MNLPENGRQFVVNLKECAHRLASQPKDGPAPDQNNSAAVALSEAIELILTHGIKIREFDGNMPLWGFLERLEILTPPCIPLRNTVGAVASIPSLRTPIARARAWVRQILNAGSTDEAVMFMMAQLQLLRSFYNPGAVLLNSEEGVGLVSFITYDNAVFLSRCC